MKFQLILPICLSFLTSCSEIEPSNSSIPENLPVSSSTPVRQSVTLNGGDLGNIDKLLLQLNRADRKSKQRSAGLFKQGKKVLEQDKKEGLHGGRSGLSKLFCASAQDYPTVEALSKCAYSLAIADAGFDTKVRRFKDAANIYRATLEFSQRVQSPIPPQERQEIEQNIQCLDAFVKNPDPKTPGCELIEISLKKP